MHCTSASGSFASSYAQTQRWVRRAAEHAVSKCASSAPEMAAHLLLLRRRRLLLSLRRLCRGRHAFRWGLCGRRLRRRGGRRRGCGRRRQLACELDGPGTGRLELPDDLGLGLDGHVVDRDHFAADGQPRGLPTNSRACSGGGQDGGEAQRQRRLASQRWRSYFCGAARNAVAGHDSFDRDAHAEAALPLRDADADGGHLGGGQAVLRRWNT